MTTNEKSGGYTGLYYFFSMAANIFAPPLAGFFMDITDYNILMVFSLLFFVLASITLIFVKKGETQEQE
jgi:MFS-type transporter involved in bile tolerance (Atg22 family)